MLKPSEIQCRKSGRGTESKSHPFRAQESGTHAPIYAHSRPSRAVTEVPPEAYKEPSAQGKSLTVTKALNVGSHQTPNKQYATPAL